MNDQLKALLIAIGVILGIGLVLTYADYRKHKRPLELMTAEIPSGDIKKYTFWHHIRVVTIPTAKYRIRIRLEKKIDIEA